MAGLGTLLAHATAVDPETGAVTPSITPSTNFARGPDQRLLGGRTYARDEAPGHAPVERLLARLDGGAEALLFSSGMAAAAAVLQTLRPGEHVVVQRNLYFGLRNWVLAQQGRQGWGLSWVDPTVIGAVDAAMRPGQTRLIWIETPANPTWDVVDIAACARSAHAHGALLVVDGTAATPVLQRPLHHGADLVVHSASKGLNGHGDVLAGAVVAKEDGPLWQQIRAWRHDTGAVLGAFEAWLLLRGLRTLELRVRRADATAMALAQRLSEHPGVRGVLYPGLPHHPGHELARRQMQGFGTTLSLLTGGGTGRAFAVAAGLHLWTRATSLGGYESLVEHRASIEGAGTLAPPDLLRLSVGLEDLEDLWADLRQALEEAPTGAAGREG